MIKLDQSAWLDQDLDQSACTHYPIITFYFGHVTGLRTENGAWFVVLQAFWSLIFHDLNFHRIPGIFARLAGKQKKSEQDVFINCTLILDLSLVYLLVVLVVIYLFYQVIDNTEKWLHARKFRHIPWPYHFLWPAVQIMVSLHAIFPYLELN